MNFGPAPTDRALKLSDLTGKFEEMDATTEICNFDDLLRSTDTADVDDLEETLLGRVEFHDDDGECEVESSDTQVSVMLIGSGIGGQGFELVYPFTMEQFLARGGRGRSAQPPPRSQEMVARNPDRRGRDVRKRRSDGRDRHLSRCGPGGPSERHRRRLAHARRTCWRERQLLEFSATPVLTEPDLFWIYAGAPLMVALGLGDDWIEVASPTYIPFGGAGPSWVHVDNVAVVDLNDAGATPEDGPSDQQGDCEVDEAVRNLLELPDASREV